MAKGRTPSGGGSHQSAGSPARHAGAACWLRDCRPREEPATGGPPASWPPRWCSSATSGNARWKAACGKAKSLGHRTPDLQRRRRPVAEHEDPAAKRVVPEHLLADPGQAVDPPAKIGRLDGHHDPHLRRDLDHDARIPEAPAQRRQVRRPDALQIDAHLRPASVLQFQRAFTMASARGCREAASSRNAPTGSFPPDWAGHGAAVRPAP